jgi:hypothetical protein
MDKAQDRRGWGGCWNTYFMTLAEYGMTLDIPCFFFTIDGEAIGQPDYTFQFIGVESQMTQRPDVITSEPFIVEVRGQNSETIHVQLGYLWQSLVILKSDSLAKSFCSETHNARILSIPPHYRQQVVNMQIRPHLDPDARPVEMRRLVRGYKLIRELWEGVGRQHGGRKSVSFKPDTVRQWSGEYEATLCALKKEMGRRRFKQLSKYDEIERKTIIKRALPAVTQVVKDTLAKSSTASHVALQYTAWRCSNIPVNTWKSDRLRDVLQESDKLNGVRRKKGN